MTPKNRDLYSSRTGKDTGREEKEIYPLRGGHYALLDGKDSPAATCAGSSCTDLPETRGCHQYGDFRRIHRAIP